MIRPVPIYVKDLTNLCMHAGEPLLIIKMDKEASMHARLNLQQLATQLYIIMNVKCIFCICQHDVTTQCHIVSTAEKLNFDYWTAIIYIQLFTCHKNYCKYDKNLSKSYHHHYTCSSYFTTVDSQLATLYVHFSIYITGYVCVHVCMRVAK